MEVLTFTSPPASPEAEKTRVEIREFLAEHLPKRTLKGGVGSGGAFDAEFSRKMGAAGWIGLTWPKRYGGHERSALERYVVLEETLAAGAPMGAHWVADRQSGPIILRIGTEKQKQETLPRIAAGECCFCIGMSEPDSGSDLASVRTRATAVKGGFVVNGTKLWTSNAHRAHFMILLCRTGEPGPKRHGGLTQFLVDMKASSGIAVRPIRNLAGHHHFNEVVFQDVFLPENSLLGTLNNGWQQVTGELALERSGPERFLSSFTLLVELVRALGNDPPERAMVMLGRLIAHLHTLRHLSRSVAGMLQADVNPLLQAALVKDLGTTFEQEIPEIARQLVETELEQESTQEFVAVLARTVMEAPSFTIRGGTREILRGIIARGLGLR